jgi:hypothetical protein
MDDTQVKSELLQKIADLLNVIKSDHLELVANRGDRMEVVEAWDELYDLLQGLKANALSEDGREARPS